MHGKSVAAAAVACAMVLLFSASAARAAAPGCTTFEHKLETVVPVPGPGFVCDLAVKAHVDPKDECESRLCVSAPPGNLLPAVGPLLKVEVVSFCGGVVFDAVVESNVFDGEIPGTTSACLGAAEVGLNMPQEGKIKLNCDDGDTKTKGTFEYECRAVE
jgi:hypothetical protein